MPAFFERAAGDADAVGGLQPRQTSLPVTGPRAGGVKARAVPRLVLFLEQLDSESPHARAKARARFRPHFAGPR